MNKLLNGNMQLMSVRVEGFRNIDESVIEFKNKITALVAPNSYGISNIINAVVLFVEGDTDKEFYSKVISF